MINAILDFEWASSDIILRDLFRIQEEFLENKELEELFMGEYFQGDISNLNEFALESRIMNIIGEISTAAVGWVNFHPTKENLERVRKKIEKEIEE